MRIANGKHTQISYKLMSSLFRSTTLLYVIILLVSGCKTDQNGQLTKLTLALGGCKGNCPSMVVEIDSSLNYKYLCLSNCDSTGRYIGTIGQSFFDSLTTSLQQNLFLTSDSSFISDNETVYVELKAQFTQKIISAKGHLDKWSEEMQEIINTVIKKSKEIELRQNTNPATWDMELTIPMNNFFKLPYPEADSSNNEKK